MVVLTRTPLLSLQPAVYDVMMPFLLSSMGRSQDSVTFLDPVLTTKKESGGAVGAVKYVKQST